MFDFKVVRLFNNPFEELFFNNKAHLKVVSCRMSFVNLYIDFNILQENKPDEWFCLNVL